VLWPVSDGSTERSTERSTELTPRARRSPSHRRIEIEGQGGF